MSVVVTNLAETRFDYTRMAIYDNALTAGFGGQLPHKRKPSGPPEPTGAWQAGKRRKKKEKATRSSTAPKRKYKKSALAKSLGTASVLNNGESGWTQLTFNIDLPGANSEQRRQRGMSSGAGSIASIRTNSKLSTLPALIKEKTSLLKLDNQIHPILVLRN